MQAFQRALAGSGVDGWTAVGKKFPSVPDVLVQRVRHTDGRRGVLKASEESPGRVRNESLYIERSIKRAEELFVACDTFPAILQRHRVWNGSQLCYFVMEDGGRTLLDATGGSAMSLGQVARLALPLIRALQAVHVTVALPDMQPELGQAHNDVKPTNILVADNGRVILIDLDVATYLQGHKGNKYPTPGSYFWSGTDCLTGMAPTPKDDLDSLGQVLMWAATGRTIWQTSSSSDPKDPKWRAALAAEKGKWRAMPWAQRAAYMHLGPQFADCFRRYYSIVDKLGAQPKATEYDALCQIWSPVADGSFAFKATAPAHVADDRVQEEEQEEQPARTGHAAAQRSKQQRSRGGARSKTKRQSEDQEDQEEEEEEEEEEEVLKEEPKPVKVAKPVKATVRPPSDVAPRRNPPRAARGDKRK